jgi:hypothetical protein
MPTPIKIISLLLIIFLFDRCNVICTEGEGPSRTDKREVSNFKTIRLSLSADVKVVKGNASSVVVEAPENLLDKITTRVSGDELNIKTDGCISNTGTITVTVTMPELEELKVEGSGNILVPDTFVVQKIKLKVSGSGDINGKFVAAKIESKIAGSGNIVLEGSANKQEASIAGSGNIKAERLPCNEAEVRISGSGDAFVYVINKLDINVNGSGTAHYKGKPAVYTHINGSGKAVDDN